MDPAVMVVAPSGCVYHRARIYFVGQYAGEWVAVMEKRRKWPRRALLSIFLIFVVLVSFFFALPKLLIGPMNLTPSDVILQISIDPHSFSDEYIVELYRQGIAKKIMCVSSQVSWDLYPADYAREHLISLGVPAEDVLSLRLPIAPCGAVNIPRIIEAVKSHGWKRALLITRPEDSRYDATLIHKYFEREGVVAAVSYAPKDKEELTQNWWRTHWKVQRFVGEAMNSTLDRFYAECR